MQKKALTKISSMHWVGKVTFSLVFIGCILLSFTINNLTDDFFKQMGITKKESDNKIQVEFLGDI